MCSQLVSNTGTKYALLESFCLLMGLLRLQILYLFHLMHCLNEWLITIHIKGVRSDICSLMHDNATVDTVLFISYVHKDVLEVVNKIELPDMPLWYVTQHLSGGWYSTSVKLVELLHLRLWPGFHMHCIGTLSCVGKYHTLFVWEVSMHNVKEKEANVEFSRFGYLFMKAQFWPDLP